MKNKKGFTLVELLAVIAILAILVIIALPNVMGMFNSAKKSSFTTELKEVYKVAQQEWMMDSMTTTGDQVYSRCKTCTGKSLQLSGRSELEYYIKIDKAGKVVQYYATDGTYQFSYDGDLLATQINDVEEIAGLEKNEIVKIANNDAYKGDTPKCKYKIITDKGSFSTNEDVKELCINPISDNYVFRNEYSGWYSGTKNARYKWLSIYAKASDLQNGSFIRVYKDSTKNQLLGELTINSLPDTSRASLNNFLEYKDPGYIGKVLGEYDRNDVYVEKSNNIEASLLYTYSNADDIAKIYTGPWLKNIEEISSIQNAINSIEALGYTFEKIESCDKYNLSDSGYAPTKVVASSSERIEDYSYPNCGKGVYFLKYCKYISNGNDEGEK